MPVDFCDAADRHFNDAVYLHDDNRFANADHLYGLAGECALKAVLRGLGVEWTELPGKKRHMPDLLSEFVAKANGRGATKYTTGLGGTPPLFCDWDVSQRYEHRDTITADRANQHKDDAKQAREIMEMAKMDGKI